MLELLCVGVELTEPPFVIQQLQRVLQDVGGFRPRMGCLAQDALALVCRAETDGGGRPINATDCLTGSLGSHSMRAAREGCRELGEQMAYQGFDHIAVDCNEQAADCANAVGL